MGERQELSLPGSELDQGTARGGEGGVPLRGAVPAGRFHCDQLPDFKPGGGALLQPAVRLLDRRPGAQGMTEATILEAGGCLCNRPVKMGN